MQTRVIMRYASEDHAVFHAIIGISWFWFIGSIYLTQMPNFTRDFLHGSADVTTMVLCVFSLGIGIGSLLCETLSGKKIEIGLVPFGALGLSVFAVDLYFVLPLESAEQLLPIAAFLQLDGSWHLLFSLLMIGMFGGFFIVPLFALVQQRSKAEHRAQIIAANNIMNSLFMVTASLLTVIALDVVGLSIPELFLVVALMNIAVAVFIFTRVPEFSMRFLIWILSHTMYRVQHNNLETVPDEGGALIVCNHVSYVDALLLAGAVKRPIRFIMFKPIFDVPVLNFIFKTGKAIPIVSQHVDQAAYDKAFDDIALGLADGDLLCIFPEGKLTINGEINEFKTGVEKILNRTPVPVIPFALQGLWGSFFSHNGGQALTHFPKRFWSRVSIVAGDILSPQGADAATLREAVLALRGDRR